MKLPGIGDILGTVVKLVIPSGSVEAIAGKLLPKVLERIAGKHPMVAGKPSYQMILHDEKIQDIVAPILGNMLRKYLPDADEDAIGRLLKKIGDVVDG